MWNMLPKYLRENQWLGAFKNGSLDFLWKEMINVNSLSDSDFFRE